MVWLAVAMPSCRPGRRSIQPNSWTYLSRHLLTAVLTYRAECIEVVKVQTCMPRVEHYLSRNKPFSTRRRPTWRSNMRLWTLITTARQKRLHKNEKGEQNCWSKVSQCD